MLSLTFADKAISAGMCVSAEYVTKDMFLHKRFNMWDHGLGVKDDEGSGRCEGGGESGEGETT